MDIDIFFNGKNVKAALALPASKTGPGVLVLHAWWGLNPFFKALCDRLAAQGFVALAPDLNNGEVARTIDEAAALMERRDDQAMHDTILAARDFLLDHSAVNSQKIGLIGFSMGAAWSLVAASAAPEKVAAVVLFYGGPGVDVRKIQAKVLGHFCEVDEWEPIEGIQDMQKSMADAGLDATIHIYPGLKHWFFEDNRPEFDPRSAELAWERSLAFLKENL